MFNKKMKVTFDCSDGFIAAALVGSAAIVMKAGLEVVGITIVSLLDNHHEEVMSKKDSEK